MKTNDIVEKIIDRKYNEYADKEFDDFYLVPVELSWEQWNSYEPTPDDIPSLVESIRYWATIALPKGDKNTWNKLQYEIANECYKKELILYEMLGKAMRKDFGLD